ncbi:murein hydrolase activator EnvC family protein, partial [Rubrivirga sp.]|uniref:murein hydrolase activator EnvC family protein n=1 Tax=Rubrivirga sp. TaxID=1885344 RepID=UPI003C74E865
MRRAVCLVFLAALAAGPSSAQSRSETERRLTSLRSQIQAVERQVRSARGDEVSALRAVESIEAEITLREALVTGYRGQVGTIQRETETLRRSIERLETEIGSAKRSYRQRARHAYIHGRRNGLALILSAGSVNQMLVRARYLQQFASRRRGQVEQIAIKTSEMRSREQTVRASLEETQRVLQQSQAEQTELARRRQDREGLVAQARTRRGRLERELSQRQQDADQLAGVVQQLVAAERRRAAAQQASAQAEADRRAAAEVAERQRLAAEAEAREREEARRAEAA